MVWFDLHTIPYRTIPITEVGTIPRLQLRLSFDPSSDFLTVQNLSTQYAVGAEHIQPVASSILLEPLKYSYLQPGNWRLFTGWK